jgi:colicin import membrane protein
MAAVVAEHRPQQPRSEQNTPAAFLLALAMHAMLVGALWISVQWNVEPSGAVTVELWGGPPAAGPAVAPEPVVVAPPPPPPAPPKVEPEPERPNADIVVKQEKKAPPKVEPPPDAKKIEAEKRRIEAEKQRAEAEAKRREAEKKQLELERRKQAEAATQAAERKRDDERRDAVRKAEEARMLAQAAGGSPTGSPGGSATGSAGGRPGGTAAGGGGDPTYAGQLIALIRPRIIFTVPENTSASVQAVFQVDLLPTGEILAVRKLKASGLPGYDEAVERAIRRTDPFPRKRDGTVDRSVIIEFRPVEK